MARGFACYASTSWLPFYAIPCGYCGLFIGQGETQHKENHNLRVACREAGREGGCGGAHQHGRADVS